MKRGTLLAVVLISVLIGAFIADADQEFNLGSSLSGTNFKILDPQHGGFGGTASSSSANYRLLGTIGDLGIGLSSGSALALRSGFLYFPFILEPVLNSAAPGNAEVDLTWTAADAGAGLTVTGYNVCTKPGAGSFTCQDVGNVLLFTKTGLSNGTSYTFKIQAYDAYANVIAESNTLSATPTGGGGGGGGGGGTLLSPSPSGGGSVELAGFAYPAAVVHLLRDGVEIATTVADAGARFSFAVSGQPAGQHTLGLWAQDRAGRRSITLAFVVTLSSTTPTRINNVIMPPTIQVADTEINVGDSITVSGSSAPGATVRLVLEPGNREVAVVARGIGDGTYDAVISTSGLAAGIYTVKARTEIPGFGISTWSQLVRVGVGVPLPPDAVCSNEPDINRDGRVDLVDFSIMAFWWRKALPVGSRVDLNCDGALTLADFSILAFHWTGR